MPYGPAVAHYGLKSSCQSSNVLNTHYLALLNPIVVDAVPSYKLLWEAKTFDTNLYNPTSCSSFSFHEMPFPFQEMPKTGGNKKAIKAPWKALRGALIFIRKCSRSIKDRQ